MTSLEKEMANLLAGAEAVKIGGEAVIKDASKIRRKSRDLSEMCDQALNDLGNTDRWASLHNRSRRGSRDYSDESLMITFKEFDVDGSGSIEKDELKAAIMKFDPTTADSTCEEMMNFADQDGDGKITFEEFKKVMLYKPPDQGTSS